MEEEQIAAIEQHGRRFVAYLPRNPRMRGEGATAAEALQRLAALLHTQAHRQIRTAPPVQTVDIRMGRR